MKIPLEIFVLLMTPFSTDEITGLKWMEDGELEPTRKGDSMDEYLYCLTRPEHLNKFWEMEKWDPEYDGARWKRGYKAQRIHLSQTAAQRGHLAFTVSSVSGVVTVRLRKPHDENLWPELRITYSVMTLDEHNHVLWNKDLGAKTKAALRNMAQSGLQKMAADPLYPLAAEMGRSSAQAATDSVLSVPQVPALTMSTTPAQDED